MEKNCLTLRIDWIDHTCSPDACDREGAGSPAPGRPAANELQIVNDLWLRQYMRAAGKAAMRVTYETTDPRY